MEAEVVMLSMEECYGCGADNIDESVMHRPQGSFCTVIFECGARVEWKPTESRKFDNGTITDPCPKKAD